MTTPQDMAAFDFGGPASHRIVIQGTVSENWQRRIGGMEITTSSREAGEPQTILQGRLSDQAALRGLLETLYALHLPILEVTKVDDSTDATDLGGGTGRERAVSAPNGRSIGTQTDLEERGK